MIAMLGMRTRDSLSDKDNVASMNRKEAQVTIKIPEGRKFLGLKRV